MKKVLLWSIIFSLLFSLNMFAQEDVDEGLSPKAKKAKEFCENGVAYYLEKGEEEAFKAFTDPEGEFIDGEYYLFVLDYLGNMLCHGVDPSLVGKNLIDLEDPSGVLFVQEKIKIANSEAGKGWVEYMWKKPPDNTIEPKVSYVLKCGDTLLIACGFYKE